MEKLDPAYNPFMSDLEIYKAGGVSWLRKQQMIIESQLRKFEKPMKIDISI